MQRLDAALPRIGIQRPHSKTVVELVIALRGVRNHAACAATTEPPQNCRKTRRLRGSLSSAANRRLQFGRAIEGFCNASGCYTSFSAPFMNWILVAVAAVLVAGVAAAIATLIARNQSLADELARQKETLGATKDQLEQTDQKLRETFQSLARDALNDNRTAFFDLAKPIADTLKKVDLRLEEVQRARVEAYARLTEKVTMLSSTTD